MAVLSWCNRRWCRPAMVGAAALLALLVVANVYLEQTRLADHQLDRVLTLASYNLAIAFAAVPCFMRARAGGPSARPWAWVGVGLVSWVTGELIYALILQRLPGPVPSPSIADALWLAYYPALLVGIWRLGRFQGLLTLRGPSIVVGALGVATLWSWTVLNHVVFESESSSTFAALTAAAYPVLDMLFLVLVGGIFARNGTRPGIAWGLITLALAATALADSWWAVQIAHNTYAVPHVVDSLWPLSAALLGTAALMPAAPRAVGAAAPRGMRMSIPLAALAIALAALMYDHFTRIDPLTFSLAGATMLAAAFHILHLYRMRAAAEGEARAAAMRSVRALATAVDAKDQHTRDHSDRVAFIAAALAFDAGLPQERIERVVLASHLHDVGKIAIPDAILLKPDRLTDEEYEVVRGHSSAGARMIEAAGLDDVAGWVRHHHERWDGNGYPSGLAGEEIPIESRVLGAADALDAMTGPRSYRVSLTTAEAADEFERCAGSQFDPRLARRVSHMLREGELELEDEALSFGPSGREREAGELLAELLGHASPLTEEIPDYAPAATAAV